MSNVDLPDRLKRYSETSFYLERLALIDDDTYELPSFPAKTTDPRHRWYRQEAGGDEAWELDAMDPNELRARVSDAITYYIDAESWERHKLTEAAEQETLRTVVENIRNAGA